MKALFAVLFFLLLCWAGYAQSTLEYATLLSRQSVAGSVKKEKGPVPQGADSAGALLRGSALLQQAGSGFGVADTSSAQGKQAVSDEPKAEPKVLEPVTKPATAENEGGLVKVYLKSGQVIEGKLVEQGNDHVKVEANGIVVTFFNEEIDKIV